jgi:hypothetical protein
MHFGRFAPPRNSFRIAGDSPTTQENGVPGGNHFHNDDADPRLIFEGETRRFSHVLNELCSWPVAIADPNCRAHDSE